MKIEEAIKTLRNHTQYFVPTSDTTALYIAIESLEKQIPKIPINQSSWKACPSCEQGIGVVKKTENPRAIKYCFHCGQKLDWGI